MKTSPIRKVFLALVIVGIVTFFIELLARHPERAWQAYLINFLVWSAIAQGALLFSTIMHTTKAKWSGPLSNLAEAFTAFFPFSIVLFVLLFLGREHIFPWMHLDLHGKEVWLNVPFLFSRDLVGLLVLYALGFAYTYQALRLKLTTETGEGGRLRAFLVRRWQARPGNIERTSRRKDVLSILYMLAFALVLSLIGFDLVMSADYHWYSTLFGAYSFAKAIYMGLGGLIILAAVLQIRPGNGFDIPVSNFHDIGKLFFAFCLVWADFFYAQLVVIWYGNISEETTYIIERVMTAPWNVLAWLVFIVCFIVPFMVLLNRKVKTLPRFMMIFCGVIIAGMWLEHLLLLGPALNHHATSIPFGVTDVLITIGFFGLMAFAVSGYLKQFPELVRVNAEKAT
ncbi:MAG: hypothetical protein PVJ53_07585 [Desulfobacterales bacterium]|jgi:hypothetical protein